MRTSGTSCEGRHGGYPSEALAILSRRRNPALSAHSSRHSDQPAEVRLPDLLEHWLDDLLSQPADGGLAGGERRRRVSQYEVRGACLNE
jgi:hypothetical protein